MKREHDNKTQSSILSQLTEALYRSIPASMMALFLLSSILTWLLYDVIEKKSLIGWYISFCSILILRGVQFVWYNRTKFEIKLHKYHYYLFIITSSITALFLGILGSFMMPQDIIYQSFIIILLSGIIAGSVQSLAASFLANIMYTYLALFPILIWEFIQILEKKEIYIGIFLGMSIFCIFSFFTARREYASLLKHIKLEYSYKVLLHAVSKMKNLYKDQANHDKLTGLYNRNFLNEYLDIGIELSRRSFLPMAIIMLDIDFFKKFNDTYGHVCGDEILQGLAEKLNKIIRKSDMACRYGGEEFLIVLPDTSLEEAALLAEVLRKAIKTISIRTKSVFAENISASLGVSIFPQNGLTKEEVIEAADNALYRAKREGRDKVCFA